MTEVELLRAALKWVLDNGVIKESSYSIGGHSEPAGFADAGCGCCSGGRMTPPAELQAALEEFLK
jgi:hypothetical protein